MARKERKYKRLPGRPFTPFDVRSLWLGPDHLLWVESVFFKEHYKRFFYSDIQAIILQRTGTHLLWSLIWGALSVVFGLIAFLGPDVPYVSGTFTVVFLSALGINLVLGPSCSVHLQTAAQVQKISSLKRVRTAQKVMARIKAMVEAAQGPWKEQDGPELRAAAIKTVTAAALPAGLSPNPAIKGPGTDSEGSFNPILHQVLYVLLLTLGALGAIQLQLKNLPLAVVATLMHGSAQIMAIVGLARWYRQLKGTMISKINWIALVFLSILTIIGYGLYMTASFGHPQISYNHWAMFKEMFGLQYSDHFLALVGNLVYAGGGILLGICGLLSLRRKKSTQDHRSGSE